MGVDKGGHTAAATFEEMAVNGKSSLLVCFAAVLLSFSIVALANDGDPDPTFSSDGKAWFVWPDTMVQAEATAVAALADGSVAVAGWVDYGSNNRDFAVAKFRNDGALDTTFADQGTRIVPFDLEPAQSDRACGVFDAGGGKVLIVGAAGLSIKPYERPALLRLNANGQPDTSFGPGGKRVIATQPLGTGASFSFNSAAKAANGTMLSRAAAAVIIAPAVRG